KTKDLPGEVEPMDAVVAQLARAVVPKPVPVVMEAVWIEGVFRRGPEPEIVVHAGGRLPIGLVTDALAVAGDPAAGERHFAQLARAHELRRAGDVGGAAPLRADLHHALVFAGRLDHAPALNQVVGDGLFDVDVFAGLTGPDGGQGVPVIGRGDGQRCHVF